MRKLENLEPKKVFEFFEDICSIPHGSGNTKKISDYLVAFAKSRGLKYIQDELNNVVIYKSATKGYENSPTVILQGHIDMVCAKTADSTIDFLTDGLDIAVDGDWVYANGTTLGGDNGSAVAMALAILDSDEYEHPDIEAVFTVDEETGMYGAEGLDFSNLKGRWLLNLDSEDDKEVTVCCAGGVRTDCILPVERTEKSGTEIYILIDGLLGGHSGMEIDKGRGNSNVLMGRLLYDLKKDFCFGIETMHGGLVENAIPLKAEATIIVDSDKVDAVLSAVENFQKIMKIEYAAADPDVSVKAFVKGAKTASVTTCDVTSKIIYMLLNLPNGVYAMCTDFPGVTETSLNMGVVDLTENEFRTAHSVRSSVASRKVMLKNKLESMTKELGGRCEFHGEYPAWEYKRVSPLREVVLSSYKSIFGAEPKIAATHGGLECGLFSGKVSDLDCVSFGPNMKDVHTPLERLSISSSGKVFSLVIEILKNCK